MSVNFSEHVLGVGPQGQLPPFVFDQLELPDANERAEMQAILTDYQDGQDATDTAVASALTSGDQARNALATATKPQTYTATAVDILLVCGQSNAMGYAAGGVGDPAYKTPNVTVWNGTTAIPLTNYQPTTQGETSTGGAWVAFANEYVRRTGRRAIIVNGAKGSMSLADLSKGAANTLYSGLVDWANGAKAHVTANGGTVGRVVVLFCQGERDVILNTGPTAYTTALTQLWTDLKADTGATLLALYPIGYYASSSIYKRRAWSIQSAQRKFAAAAPDAIVAFDDIESMGALGMKADDVHLTQRGYNLMGEKSAGPVVSTLFTDSAAAQEPSLARQGLINLDGSQEWKFYGGWLVGPDFAPSTDTHRAVSGVVSVTRQTNFVEVTLADKVDYILAAGASLKSIKSGAIPAGTAGITPTFDQLTHTYTDGQGRTVVRIYFIADVTARVRMASQSIDANLQGATLSALLSGSGWGPGTVTVAHPVIKGLASATSREVTNPRVVSAQSFDTTTTVKAWDLAGNPANAEVALVLPSMRIDTTALDPALEMTFFLIGAEKRPS